MTTRQSEMAQFLHIIGTQPRVGYHMANAGNIDGIAVGSA